MISRFFRNKTSQEEVFTPPVATPRPAPRVAIDPDDDFWMMPAPQNIAAHDDASHDRTVFHAPAPTSVRPLEAEPNHLAPAYSVSEVRSSVVAPVPSAIVTLAPVRADPADVAEAVRDSPQVVQLATAKANETAANYANENTTDRDAKAVKLIESLEDIPHFTENLYEVVNLSPSWKHKICPILLDVEGAPQYALVLLEEIKYENIVENLCERIELRGYHRSPTDFFIFADRNVLISLSRGEGANVGKATKKNSFMGHDESALKAFFEEMLVFCLDNEGSDIHIFIDKSVAKSEISFRVDGFLCGPDRFSVSTGLVLDMAAYIYNVLGKSGSENSFNENVSQQCDVPYVIKKRKINLRWASTQSSKGCKIVLRFLLMDDSSTIRSLPELGFFPDQVETLKTAIGGRQGGLCIAGVVGSGKSTTSQTLMSMYPPGSALYSVEDPVEYDMPGVVQISVSRTLNDDGSHDPYMAAKRQLKRLDLNAVLIGEVRDALSAGLFRDICESGHSAITTVHAPSAIDMITLRLASSELGIPRDVIATPGFINLLMYQALLPLNCPHCRLDASDPKTNVEPGYLKKIERFFGINADKIKFRNHAGCIHCKRPELPQLNGIKGRTVVAETVELDHKMLRLYRDGQNLELKNYIRSLRRAAFDEPGHTGKTVLEVAMYKVSLGQIDPFEVERKFGTFHQYERDIDAGKNEIAGI
jgi:general secretion pathway protein E